MTSRTSPCTPPRTANALRRARGFTVIEMLVVLAILALLLSIAAPTLMGRVQGAEETALRHNLAVVREAIDQFHADQGHYPQALQDLVTPGYLNHLPVDPITQSATTWVLVPVTPVATSATSPTVSTAVSGAGGDTSGFADIHSGAPGKARDGEAYASW